MADDAGSWASRPGALETLAIQPQSHPPPKRVKLLRSPVHTPPAVRWAAASVALLGLLALVLWALGVGSSSRPWVSPGVKPDRAYWSAARACRRVFSDAADQRRCSELALNPSSSTLQAGAAPSFRQAAREGVYELIGWTPGPGGTGTWNTNGKDTVRWNYTSGLWGGNELSHWWQSAIVLRTLVRYLEHTDKVAPIYQTVLERTYKIQVEHPWAIAKPNFVNAFGDDTGWWGLAWLEASNYELHYLHNLGEAQTFLSTAEYDAHWMQGMNKSCGGFVWEQGFPTNTVTNAEFIALAAELYAYRSAPGPFHDPAKAQAWLRAARSDLKWLEHSGLINMRTGRVSDHLTSSCRVVGGPLTYSEGQTAEALIQMGNALHQPSYYRQAEPFLSWITSRRKSNMDTPKGILQEPCESQKSLCLPQYQPRSSLAGTPGESYLDQLTYKGIVAQALDDYGWATGSAHYEAYLRRQATAIVNNAITDGKGRPGNCHSPTSCQFIFYWGWPLGPSRPMKADGATQMSALAIFTGVLPRAPQTMPTEP
jgi:hypothetical protein